jgi:hypothetical protein
MGEVCWKGLLYHSPDELLRTEDDILNLYIPRDKAQEKEGCTSSLEALLGGQGAWSRRASLCVDRGGQWGGLAQRLWWCELKPAPS